MEEGKSGGSREEELSLECSPASGVVLVPAPLHLLLALPPWAAHCLGFWASLKWEDVTGLPGRTQRELPQTRGTQTRGGVCAPPVVSLCSRWACVTASSSSQVVQDLLCVVVAGVVCHLDQPVSGSHSGGTGGVGGASGGFGRPWAQCSSPDAGRVGEQP